MPRTRRRSRNLLIKSPKTSKRENNLDATKKIQDAIEKYNYIWRIEVQAMRNSILKEVRSNWEGKGRFFFTKNSLIKKVFESEPDNNLDELSSLMEGQSGILCTNEKVETVIEDLKNFVKPDFARTNSIIDQTIIIPRGVIKYGSGDVVRENHDYDVDIENNDDINNNNNDDDGDNGIEVSHTLNPLLNKLGLPSKINLKQKLMIQDAFVVCQSGDKLTENQAHLLKILGYQLAEFKMIPTHYYDKSKKITVTL
ncbi:hypothetical protein Glove_460g51 [Diversispora epigaea]|uniref:Large ribosomal subunit protein uL10-like insertion domain-containing protein n=1 Tax=Diversispora epigaea TaxID=1348612 RepID=A0A397GNI5_9GLOM|nr:hypothetical protein Glove_460g51 [Diversispora epigaea]